MSRHKLVKALDLDEELDDFEGVDEFGYDEEVSAEDKGVDFLLMLTKMRAWVPVCLPID